ncbi:MAG TPA: GAF domain-containing protein, partial [Vicinamibacterales bacterium]|nr:GAF domain-containing protein [Vicinamibacterales bacterium]
PLTPGRGSVTGRAALERRAIHIPDVTADPEYERGDIQKHVGYRTALAVPMLREGALLGVFFLWKARVEPFTEKQIELVTTFADQAVIAIENVRLFQELETRNRDLTEALEQQTATAEILRVISSSPTDVQPVFDTIVRSAVRLCDGLFGAVNMFDGEMVHRTAASHNYTPDALAAVERLYPMRPSRQQLTGRAILTRAVAHLPDVLDDPEYVAAIALAGGWRSGLAAPLLREGHPIGTILVTRTQAGPFSERQIELLKTFADQAVIAIENVRLFQELEARNRDLTEALEQQTATGEVLQVISSSPTDVQPIFDVISRSAARLCDALDVIVLRVDGELLRLVSHTGSMPAGDVPLHRGTLGGRTVLERRVIHVEDLQAAENEFPEGSAIARQRGHRSTLSVPLLREGVAIGNIQVRRHEVRPFSDTHIRLLQTFADQAVIAIENVRLFQELEVRNRDLTEALEQQTATSEILSVISSSPTDVQPVFNTIVVNAVRLCNARMGAVYRFDGELVHMVAHHNYPPEVLEVLQRMHPRPPHPDQASGRAILTRAVAQIEDMLADPQYRQEVAVAGGWRSIIAVPMLREGVPIGAIVITRNEAGFFPAGHIDLLKTFADQAVIAIENVRLFQELEARNHDLSEALEQQTATSEILRAISSAQTDAQPVFETIVRNAVRLCNGFYSVLFSFDGEWIRVRAMHNVSPVGVEAFAQRYPMRAEERRSTIAQVVSEGRVIRVRDMWEDDAEVHPESRRFSKVMGHRSYVSVPMVKDGRSVGAITVS